MLELAGSGRGSCQRGMGQVRATGHRGELVQSKLSTYM